MISLLYGQLQMITKWLHFCMQVWGENVARLVLCAILDMILLHLPTRQTRGLSTCWLLKTIMLIFHRPSLFLALAPCSLHSVVSRACTTYAIDCWQGWDWKSVWDQFN